jgi:glycosyltransferase involved in cell wall biosynthesis
MKSPCVSVVIASYNHFNFVQKSIQSVCDQTFDNVELIVIDDGSTDDDNDDAAMMLIITIAIITVIVVVTVSVPC